MQVCSFDPNRLGSGRIFPDSVELLEGVVYHGTSSFYSGEIEHAGLRRQTPIAPQDLERLVDIGKAYGVNTGDLSEYLTLRSISFTPVSEVSLFFVRTASYGGQGLLQVTRLIQTLVDKAANKFQPEEQALIDSIQLRIAAIREPPPVIYAVDVKGIPQKAYSALIPSLAALHVYIDLPPENIVAKMSVDSSAQCTEATKKELMSKFQSNLATNPHHWINQLLK